MNLNELAFQRLQQMLDASERYQIQMTRLASGAGVVDCGVHQGGSLAAGQAMAEISMASLGQVRLSSGPQTVWPGPWVSVTTDHPVAACMASQYAGWRIATSNYFAMGSGPMRAARGEEPLLDAIGYRQSNARVVGVLESSDLPDASVCQAVAQQCRVQPAAVTLLVAPTASLAGTIQVVARSVETALHKMHELGFDLAQVRAGWGQAPLPPVAAEDLVAIGRTNDAVLYAGRVTLWVHADDQQLQTLGPQIPSASSPDYGEPFGEIFKRYDGDFYRIDPLLFSPACIQLVNLASGSAWQYGTVRSDVLQRSFGSSHNSS
jgi:methenyltetrahydromethanopterin cyclohydrolase